MKYDGTNLEEVLEESRKFIASMGYEGSRAVFDDLRIREFKVPEEMLSNAEFHAFNCDIGDFRNAYLELTRFISSEFRNTCFGQAFMGASCFYDTSFFECDFTGVDFSNSLFYGCYFFRCNLRAANFEGANFVRTSLENVSNIPYIPTVCPDAGAFIGWKRAMYFGDEQKDVIVKLLIPDDAKRLSCLGRKCRCDKAIVLEIQDLEGDRLPNDTIAMSYHDNSFGYIVGRTVTPEKPFNENRFDECASGIHFFVNREEAVRYSYF